MLESDYKTIVTKVVESLGEHFDTVHVFATVHDPSSDGGTVNVSAGVGNWLTRYGQVKDFVIRTEEHSKCDVWFERNGDGNNEEDDNEDGD